MKSEYFDYLSVLNEPDKNKKAVAGYISKESSSYTVLNALEEVPRGEYAFDANALNEIVEYIKASSLPLTKGKHEAIYLLSNREQEIFYLLLKDAQIAEIAGELSISPKTVENHRTSIYRKLRVYDRYTLQQFAKGHNIL